MQVRLSFSRLDKSVNIIFYDGKVLSNDKEIADYSSLLLTDINGKILKTFNYSVLRNVFSFKQIR